MLNHKKVAIFLFTATVIINYIVYLIWEPPYDSLCGGGIHENRDCVNLINNLSEPVFWSFLALLPVTIALFFLRREVFVAWVKFAAIGFPIMLAGLLYTFNMPQSTGSFMGGPSESEIASVVLPGLFLIISLLIIAIKSWKLRKMNGAE
ncbi:hypothetical protein ACFL0K_00235 [Patescibacteria group bacterium]